MEMIEFILFICSYIGQLIQLIVQRWNQQAYMRFANRKKQIIASGLIAIYFVFIVGSVLQQRIIKDPYENSDTFELDYFNSPNTFVLIPTFISWVLILLINNKLNPLQRTCNALPSIICLKPSILMFIGSYLVIQAMYLISFNFVILFKSLNVFNFIAVAILCNQIYGRQFSLGNKAAVGLLAAIGVFLFLIGEIEGEVIDGETSFRSYFGTLCLVLSLFCDGLVPSIQTSIQRSYKLEPFFLLERLIKYKMIISLVYSFVSQEIESTIIFFFNHPESLAHVFAYSVTEAISSLLIFWLISKFSQKNEKNSASFQISPVSKEQSQFKSKTNWVQVYIHENKNDSMNSFESLAATNQCINHFSIIPFIIAVRKIFNVLVNAHAFQRDLTWFQVTGICVVFIAVIGQLISDMKQCGVLQKIRQKWKKAKVSQSSSLMIQPEQWQY